MQVKCFFFNVFYCFVEIIMLLFFYYFYQTNKQTKNSLDIQLENPESVIKLRDTLIQTLQDCVSILRPQTAINHLSQLFLCLPLLRQLDNVTRRLWLNILQEGSIPMQKLFVEMLESNATF